MTKSTQYFSLFGRFQQGYISKEEESLRRMDNVEQLRGHVNSQKDEQLHAKYNHDMRYLNEMKPVNHIFVFRSNVSM